MATESASLVGQRVPLSHFIFWAQIFNGVSSREPRDQSPDGAVEELAREPNPAAGLTVRERTDRLAASANIAGARLFGRQYAAPKFRDDAVEGALAEIESRPEDRSLPKRKGTSIRVPSPNEVTCLFSIPRFSGRRRNRTPCLGLTRVASHQCSTLLLEVDGRLLQWDLLGNHGYRELIEDLVLASNP